MLVLMLNPSRVKNDDRSTITIEHAGETMKIVLIESNNIRSYVGFEAPRSFKITRHSAKQKTRDVPPSGGR